MRAKVARQLRRAAAYEMALDKVPDRDLVMGRNSVVNSPKSVRAMYLKMKQAYKNLRKRSPAPLQIVARKRKPGGVYRPLILTGKPALIQRPLRMLARLFPPTRNERGEYEPSSMYYGAMICARRGQGHYVQSLARRYA